MAAKKGKSARARKPEPKKKAENKKEQPGTTLVLTAPPTGDTTPAKMKARAKELDAGLRSRRDEVRKGPLEDGLDAAEMARGNLWVLLGYDDENAYRQSLNIGRSTWYRYKKLAIGLEKLPREEFLKLVAENADHLIKLPENRRYDPDLIKKAQTLTEEAFEKVVVKFNAKADKVDEGEVVVALKWRMPESRRAFILETLKEFQTKNHLDDADDSRVLELALADLRTSDHVRTKVIQRIPALKGTYDLLNGQAGNLSADEVMSKAHEEIGNFIRDVSQAAGYDLRQAKGVGGVQ